MAWHKGLCGAAIPASAGRRRFRLAAWLTRAAARAGVERRVNLSSIRAPRMGGRDRQPEPWAVEAKEFLRWVGQQAGKWAGGPVVGLHIVGGRGMG